MSEDKSVPFKLKKRPPINVKWVFVFGLLFSGLARHSGFGWMESLLILVVFLLIIIAVVLEETRDILRSQLE